MAGKLKLKASKIEKDKIEKTITMTLLAESFVCGSRVICQI